MIEKIHAKKVRSQLSKFFKFSFMKKNIILTDSKYECVSEKEIKKYVRENCQNCVDGRKCNCDGISYDCDDYARDMFAKVRRDKPAWPFGIVLLNKVSGVKQFHAKCVCVTQEGVLLIEPQASAFSEFLLARHRVSPAIKGNDVFMMVYI